MIGAEVRKGDGTQIGEVFLIDSGADRTVLTQESFLKLGMSGHRSPTHPGIVGLGGETDFLLFETTLRLKTVNGDAFEYSGEFVAVTNPAALDICLLGRDILDQFDLILSRRKNQILLLTEKHGYTISDSTPIPISL